MKPLQKLPLRFWVALGAILIASCLSLFRTFQDYELLSYDLRLRLRPPLPVSPDIVLIEISDDTLVNLGKWPLPRDFHASLIDVLKEYGARLIVFDVLFSEPTLYDEVFCESIKKAANAYLPLAFYLPEGHPLGNGPVEARQVLAPLLPELNSSAAGTGQINVFIDRDGKIRRVPLFIKYENALFASLGLSAACAWEGADLKKVEFGRRKVVIDNKIALPVSAGTSFLVNYPDTWQRSFRHFSYFEILKSYNDTKKGLKPKIDLAVLKDKACFIGLTATGTSDLRANPLENVYPMLGLQASVFNSVIQRKFIIDAGILPNTLINLFILLLSFLLCLKFRPLKAFCYNVVLGAGYFAAAWAIFAIYGLWVDLFLPLAIIFLSYVGSLLYRFLDELRKRELLEKELDIARTIQKSFLPEVPRGFAGLDIAVFMQPAKFVAGDLYDIAVIDEKRIGILIGDVSGKGVPASLIMAQTISFFRIFSRRNLHCSDVLNHLNKELYGKFGGRFVTALYLIIDTQDYKVNVSSAGQAPLLVYQKLENQVQEAPLSVDLPLGVSEDLSYQQISFQINPGDRLTIFTDGVSEARNRKAQEFGTENVKNTILEKAGAGPEQISSLLKERIAKFTASCTQHDDITLIILGRPA